MWTLCKELKGTQYLNERDCVPYGYVMGINLWYVKQIGWQGLLRCGRI
jgi:hypothetical protein